MEKKIVSNNKKARHDYFINDTYEAGIELTGTEIKSVRGGAVNLKDSFAKVVNGEVFVFGMHISPYAQGNRYNQDPMRPKKLLLHKKEIRKMDQALNQDGLTLIPLDIYLIRGKAKLTLAIAKGKAMYDKREDIAKRDAKRDIDRRMKNN